MNIQTKTIIRYLFVILLGVFLYFAYELSGGNLIVGLFASVNESVWEHLKLVFYPMLVLTLWDSFASQRNSPHFLAARTKATLAGMVFVVVVYYTITGIIGQNIDWINILIYLLSIVFVFWIEKKYQNKRNRLSTRTAVIIWIIFIILFVIFTLAPPALGIFIPPVI